MNKNDIYEELREKSLEDVYNILCKNEPKRNSKRHKMWDYLESIAYEELLDEDFRKENKNKCDLIVDMIINYLKMISK